MDAAAALREIFADSGSESSFSDAELSDVSDGDMDDLDVTMDQGGGGDTPPTTRQPAFDYDHEWLKAFSNQGTGPQNIPDDPTECDIMRLFLSDDVITLCVTETNRYARQFLANHPNLPPFSRFLKWTDTDEAEMRAFLALLLLTGLSKRSSYELYWSSDPLIDMKGFREVMSRDRFMNMMSFFHIVNNDHALPKDNPHHDKAFKIRPLIDLLVPLWQQYYVPGKEISIDESMIPFKGRTSLMQYMPAKPTKWGLKAWGLAESKTGYMYNWQLYLGKENQRNNTTLPVTHRVVTGLCEPLYDLGHVVYMDNFFTSPALFQQLAEHQTGACGTLRVNRAGVPDTIKQAKPKAGDPPFTDYDNPLLYMVWYDKRPVSLLTTVHSSKTFRKEVRSKHGPNNTRVVQKPVAIQAYTQHMGGIDRADKAMTFYMVLHRCMKWWKKVFFYLLEICFCNSLIIWRSFADKRINAEKFRLKIVHGLLIGYVRTSASNVGRPVLNPPTRMVSGEHYLGLNTKRKADGSRSNPDCVVCSNRKKRRHQTKFICKKCDKAMCPVPCFERFHSLLNFKIECTPDIHQ